MYVTNAAPDAADREVLTEVRAVCALLWSSARRGSVLLVCAAVRCVARLAECVPLW